ncbi:MAG: GntR family transcriptional regulator [Chitinivibrionales bacterium]|nr:GntR family transcriptional regulator [Chitinivibrionales bacterium]
MTTNPRLSPAVSQLASWIRMQVAQCQPGTALPCDQELAQQWGLSRRTIGKIMRSLAAEGLVIRARRRGTCTAGRLQGRLDPPERTDSASALASSIRAQIQSGQLRTGESLPTVQFTAHERKVSPHTVIAAYRLLARQGLVHKIGRSYRCGTPDQVPRQHGTAPVTVVSHDTMDLRRLFADPSFGKAYFELEEELARHGRPVRYLSLSTLTDTRGASGWAGMLFAQPAPGDRSPVRNPLTDRRVRELLTRVPSLIDLRRQTTGGKPPTHFIPRRPPRCLYLYRPWLSHTLKTTLVDYIVRERYRRVRFIIDLRDVARHFPALSDDLPRHGRMHPTPPFLILWDILDIRKMLESSGRPVAFSIALLGVAGSDPVAESIRERIAGIAPSRYSFRQRAPELVSELSFHDTAAGLCDDLLEDELWVCKSDELAEQVLHAAEDKGVAVPGRISLLSLDNDPAYYHLGLSRCELDWQGLGYLMAHWFIGDIPVARTREGYLRANGRIVEKSTTGRFR